MMQFAGAAAGQGAGRAGAAALPVLRLVGALGVMVHLAVLGGFRLDHRAAVPDRADHRNAGCHGLQFPAQQPDHLSRPAAARARLWRGLLLFVLVCGIGAVANVGIAQVLYETSTNWKAAGAIGAVIGVVWNYAVSATLVWRAK